MLHISLILQAVHQFLNQRHWFCSRQLDRYFASGEVQFGQRVALMGIWVKQKGHSFVVGAAGAATGCAAF